MTDDKSNERRVVAPGRVGAGGVGWDREEPGCLLHLCEGQNASAS